MLDVADAQARIWRAFEPLGAEWVALGDACGRVLAADLHALHDQPPAAMSAMDGYAVRASDVAPGKPLEVIGESLAGHLFDGELSTGQAVRIFTGAVVPPGADAVLIQENAERQGQFVTPAAALEPTTFVRPRGLDFAKGWAGLQSGCALDPRAIGLAAAMGHGHLPVRRKPRIALIATGDELRLPGVQPGPGEIISSNTPALTAMIRAWGGDVLDLGIVPDRAEPLVAAFQAASAADLIVTTGGASVGDFDLVQSAAGRAGMELDFWKIRMRPGKPLIFGKLFGKPLLGLPGNPVSASVCAIVFLRGVLCKMLGLTADLGHLKVELAAPLSASGARQDYVRGTYTNAAKTMVRAAGRQDSSMFATFAQADVLIVRPPSDPPKKAGEIADIIDLAACFEGIA